LAKAGKYKPLGNCSAKVAASYNGNVHIDICGSKISNKCKSPANDSQGFLV
jgi:hypothetical protein